MQLYLHSSPEIYKSVDAFKNRNIVRFLGCVFRGGGGQKGVPPEFEKREGKMDIKEERGNGEMRRKQGKFGKDLNNYFRNFLFILGDLVRALS